LEEPQAVAPARVGGNQIIPRPDRWAPGSEAPWVGQSLPDVLPLAPLLARVAQRGRGKPPTWSFEGSRSSAVLIALFEGDHGAEVVLTRRAWHLRSHKGEVCFPGGRQDEGETAVETALREAHEEVLLDPADVTVVGELDHLATLASNSSIVPVVGHLTSRPILSAGTSEVDRIFTVPLVDLLRADTFREELWTRDDRVFPVTFFELDDETIWGATARLLRDLLLLATARY
jgi:8-oxo-dGTP pyrophosphatase MutT (NUDIX family)